MKEGEGWEKKWLQTGTPRCILDGGPYEQPNLGIVPSTLKPL